MSYYVIKGPFSGRYYLCSLPGYATPQWLDGKEGREKANRFPDEDSAWKYIQLIVRENPKFDTGRVVRVNTLRDWKAERAQLRADRDNYRAMTDIMRGEIKGLTRERDEAKALVETWKANDAEYERMYREAKAKLEAMPDKRETRKDGNGE